MPRYFIEVSYKGTNYSGFQVQQNANSIQAEVERALQIYFKQKFALTGSSRTDAGVHALQNFFHFDSLVTINDEAYNLNAILPWDIAVKYIYEVDPEAHCRFDAISREYRYFLYQYKQPFLQDRAYYYPYSLDMDLLQQAAGILMDHVDFASFSKRNTQVKNFLCNILESSWSQQTDCLVYKIKANRFLRGMVKGSVGTMLQVGRQKMSVPEFKAIIEGGDCTKSDFSVPSHALFLYKVEFS
jgi:tRNA pseudouridine38-40 synthase